MPLVAAKQVEVAPPFLLSCRQQNLENDLRNLAISDKTHGKMHVGIFAVRPATGQYLDINGQGAICCCQYY